MDVVCLDTLCISFEYLPFPDLHAQRKVCELFLHTWINCVNYFSSVICSGPRAGLRLKPDAWEAFATNAFYLPQLPTCSATFYCHSETCESTFKSSTSSASATPSNKVATAATTTTAAIAATARSFRNGSPGIRSSVAEVLHLHLSEDGVRNLITQGSQNLPTNLQTLTLPAVYGLDPVTFSEALSSRLTALTQLNFADSRLASSCLEAIGSCRALRILRIPRSLVSDKGATAIASLCHLTILDLSDSKIKPTELHILIGLTQLRALNLWKPRSMWNDECRCGTEGVKVIACLTQLTCLNISSNNIGYEGAAHLAHLSHLTYLNLRANKIKDEGASALINLTELVYLDIGNNGLSAVGAFGLTTLSQLKLLRIGDNYIGVEGAKAIAALTKLTWLDIHNNHIGNEGAEAIAKKLSNLKFLNAASIHSSAFDGEESKNGISDSVTINVSSLSKLTSLNFARNDIERKRERM